jgi:hypothetical protein
VHSSANAFIATAFWGQLSNFREFGKLFKQQKKDKLVVRFFIGIPTGNAESESISRGYQQASNGECRAFEDAGLCFEK